MGSASPPSPTRLAGRALLVALAGLLAFPIAQWVLPHSPRDDAASEFWALLFIAPPLAAIMAIGVLIRNKRSGSRPASVAALAAVVLGAAGTLVSPPWVLALISQSSGLRTRVKSTHCLSNLKELGTALALYSQDFDGRMPPIGRWNETLSSRVAAMQPGLERPVPLLECAAEPTVGTPSYAMNRALAGADLRAVDAPDTLVSVYDSKPGRNVAGGSESLPPTPRHAGADAIAMADGHAKLLRRDMDQARWKP